MLHKKIKHSVVFRAITILLLHAFFVSNAALLRQGYGGQAFPIERPTNYTLAIASQLWQKELKERAALRQIAEMRKKYQRLGISEYTTEKDIDEFRASVGLPVGEEDKASHSDFGKRQLLGLSDKARMLDYIVGDKVIELGCGEGSVGGLVKKRFPDARVVGIDFEEKFLRKAKDDYPDCEFYCRNLLGWTDIDKFRGQFSTVILSSTLHEIEGEKVSKRVLRIAYELLEDGGVLIFRDGVKPDNKKEEVEIILKTPYAKEKFERFVREYRHRKIRFTYTDETHTRISIVSYDLQDLLCKYYFEEELWERDMDESFGHMNRQEYRELISRYFTITHNEEYIAPYLKELWERDFQVVDKDYPKSHTLIVARKGNKQPTPKPTPKPASDARAMMGEGTEYNIDQFIRDNCLFENNDASKKLAEDMGDKRLDALLEDMPCDTRKSFYRGLRLRPDSLRKIITDGLLMSDVICEEKYYDEKRMSFSLQPGWAISASFLPILNPVKLLAKVWNMRDFCNVVVQVDAAKMQYAQVSEDEYYTTKDVSPDAILKLFVFDKNASRFVDITAELKAASSTIQSLVAGATDDATPESEQIHAVTFDDQVKLLKADEEKSYADGIDEGGLVVSIESYLSALQKLKEQLYADMTPEIEGERELPDEEFDFEWVFEENLKPPPGCYEHFWDMVDIAKKREVRREKLRADGSNIFDRSRIEHMKLMGALTSSMYKLGFEKDKVQWFDYWRIVVGNRNLSPTEITRKFIRFYKNAEPTLDFIAIGTSAMKGYRKGTDQYNALNPLISALRNYCERRGVKFICDDREAVHESVRAWKKADKKARGIVLDSEGSIDELVGMLKEELKIDLEADENVLLAGVDNKNMEEDLYYMRLMEMLSLTLELLRKGIKDEEAIQKAHEHLGFKKKGPRRISFEPDAEPMKYEELREIYQLQIFA